MPNIHQTPPATPWQTLWTCGGVLSKCSLQSTSWCVSVCVLMYCVECTVPSPAPCLCLGGGWACEFLAAILCTLHSATPPPEPPNSQAASKQEAETADQPKGRHTLALANLGENTQACIPGNACSHGLTEITLDSESSERRFESWLGKASEPNSGSRQVSSRP